MARLPVLDNAVPAGTPSIHAFVIGVGHYTSGLPALDAAAPSALAFADWLRKEQALPGLVLGSIDVLASQPSGAPVSWEGKDLDPPTIKNVQEAVDEWHARLGGAPESLGVFYFCGHGVETGGFRSLLTADVDPTSKTDPFRNAVAFEEFVDGMDGCGGRQQLYVLDACRELPPGFAKWDDGVPLGQPLIRVNFAQRAKLTSRVYAVLDATSSTQKAWAGPKGRGWFTDALLTVLEGAAGNNRFTASVDEYSISTRDIADTIKQLVKGDFLDPPAGPQNPLRRGEGDLDLHVPKQPIVPILVTRKPPATNIGCQFVALKGADQVAAHACADERPWRGKLPIGDYEFRNQADSVAASVSVPSKRVELP